MLKKVVPFQYLAYNFLTISSGIANIVLILAILQIVLNSSQKRHYVYPKTLQKSIHAHSPITIINLSDIIVNNNIIRYMTSTLSFLTLITLISFSYSQLKHERVQIVHSNQQHRNYFVRGNLPIDADKRFQMDQLGYVLTSLTGLQNYQLKVISFLNFLTAKETKNRYIEEKYFEKNPQRGQYKTQLILGSLIDPNYFSPSTAKVIQAVTSLFDLDQVDALVSEIHEELKKGSNKIIFIHCSAGMDRTGLVAGSYKLKYLNYSLQQVLQENSKFGGPRKIMHSPFLNALKWFCLSHKDQSACK